MNDHEWSRMDRDLARGSIKAWSEKSPDYANAVALIKDFLASRDRRSDVGFYQVVDHMPRVDDEGFRDVAAASLGMGTKMIPSARYGSHYHTGPDLWDLD